MVRAGRLSFLQATIPLCWTAQEVNLKREHVNLSPVYYTALKAKGADDGSVGYVRLTQFSNNAAEDMRAAITDLEAQGVGEYILDLRSNPGGLVSAGINVASLWLDGEKPVFNIEGREVRRVRIYHSQSLRHHGHTGR